MFKNKKNGENGVLALITDCTYGTIREKIGKGSEKIASAGKTYRDHRADCSRQNGVKHPFS